MAAQIERAAVEALEVERGALTLPDVSGPGARSVRRPCRTAPARGAEIALEFEDHGCASSIGQCSRMTPARGRGSTFAGVETEGVVGQGSQIEMHTDVDDHPYGSQRLAVEHAEHVGRVVEEAEIVHQPFGVERPALAVTPHPTHQPLPAVEDVLAVGGLADRR